MKPKSKHSRWKEKLKADPERYAEFKKDDAQRAKLYRLNLTEEQREKVRKQTRERVRKYRERKKQKEKQTAVLVTCGSNIVTRSEEKRVELQRLKWCLEKRAQRANRSSQKKRRDNEKCRKAYQERKANQMKIKLTNRKSSHGPDKPPSKTATSVEIRSETPLERSDMISETTPPHILTQHEISHAGDNRSCDARRKALSRARKALPLSPEKYAGTLCDLIDKASPRKLKSMELRGLNVVIDEEKKRREFAAKTVEVIQDKMESLKHKRTKKDMVTKQVLSTTFGVLRRYRLMRRASRNLGISWNLLARKKTGRPTRHKTKRNYIKQKVENFYENASIYLPDKNKVKKGKARKILDKSLKDLFKEFKKQNTNIKISLSNFSKMRPKHINTARTSKLRQCLYEYCTNIEEKLKVLNNFTKEHPKCRIKDKYVFSQITLCKDVKDGDDSISCLERNCSSCGIQKIDNYLKPVIRSKANNICEWYKWESQMFIKENNEKQTKKVLVKKTGSFGELVAELKDEAVTYSMHLFNAKWQNEQFRKLRDHPPKNHVIQVLDFAENYTCLLQNEVQAAHWNHHMATVHPLVCYYNCEKCDRVITESCVCISDDLKHDHHAVHVFALKTAEHLQYTRKLNIDKYIQFTDGAASQYKSKGPFLDISYSKEDFKCDLDRNFFGSRHGKGPSDGESAVVKRQAANAIKTGQAVIDNARAMYEFCVKSLTKSAEGSCAETHFRRTFFWVDSKSISCNRGRVGSTVKGTRSIHCIRSIEKGFISRRKLSCYCESCLKDNGECENVHIVGDWKPERLEVTSFSPETCILFCTCFFLPIVYVLVYRGMQPNTQNYFVIYLLTVSYMFF